MTDSEKAEIVARAKPMRLLISKLGLTGVEVKERNKILNKHKAFVYRNYDGGFRSANVYQLGNEYFCSLYKPPSGR
ncbi:hypothetical protein [Limnovirga soli]|jgi:hypothetical protein|uniref:Uncharacterized protein n=1 Tax=Limnovirga soli TaxID=2656915 RepID=A0A8J8FGJ9_9BACT|nr:hypothetical protein [Limnovirga soli]NNV57660.1 hypothetical protein [Limnovirga soli]